MHDSKRCYLGRIERCVQGINWCRVWLKWPCQYTAAKFYLWGYAKTSSTGGHQQGGISHIRYFIFVNCEG